MQYGGQMFKHNWMATMFDGNAIFQGVVSQIHTCICRNCGKLAVCLDTELPDSDGCSNAHPPKPKWKAPIKEKEVDRKDYPAAKQKRR